MEIKARKEYSEQDKQGLMSLARGRNTAQKVVLRANIVLKMMEGLPKKQIAEQLGTTRPTVYLWIKRHEEWGIEGLRRDAPRPGRKPEITEEKERAIVEATLRTKPQAATHWSIRSMAKAQAVSRWAVHKIWKKYNLKPHLVKTFKISQDPNFVEKVKDIVGLYLHPPDKAIVLSVDEKSQIQALDRTQPGLPLRVGHAGTITHDYKRHGTTTLFAALNILDGRVTGQCMPKHRQVEFLKFLRKIDNESPAKMDLHLIVDNYGSHKTVKVKRWLSAHPRFHLHFTPTSASWMNMVERFFSELTTKRIRRGIFRTVAELEEAIMNYLAVHNDKPRIFVWTKDADTILSKVEKCKEVLQTGH
jgi:transposase